MMNCEHCSPSAQDVRLTNLSRSSPIHVSSRGNGLLKDKAASDAEVENRRSALAPLKAALTKLGEETQRPDTAPSGPAEMDMETKRRSAQIMQDFFKETNLREELQEQCNDLSREVDNLQAEKAKLRKQLQDAEAAIAEKDRAMVGVSNATASDETAHTTLVDEMGRKFARETKQLEEQSQKLEEEKQAEATKAAELQQVLDDLNDELERQGQEWDAEKKKLVEQATQIAVLTKEVASLRKERNALSQELESTRNTLSELQTKITELEQNQTSELRSRDDKVNDLTNTVEELRAEAESAEERHSKALQEAQESLEAHSSESSALVEQLQLQVQSLQQQHTDELRSKDETIESHVKAREELQNDLSNLQQRADQTSAELESERSAHAEELQQKVEELQKRAAEDLRAKEDDMLGHLKSIDELQEQIAKFQQGETDGARLAQELHKQMEELKESHEAALKVRTDENDELVQQLDAINDQLSADASELEQLKDEAEGLRKTISTLEQVSQQESSQHASEVAKIRAELNEATKKAESHKTELDAVQDKHQQDLRSLEETHEAKIQSLKADLEGDANERLSKLQASYDALVVEKNAALEQYEKASEERAKELQTLQKDLIELQESSGSASQDLTKALAKHKQLEEEKAAAEEAHSSQSSILSAVSRP
jgi:chromosome segregation ATPase